MRVYMEPVDMIAHFKVGSYPKPVRFKFKDRVVNVDRIIHKEVECLAGFTVFVYRCESLIGDIVKVFEIKYEVKTMKWFLFKM